MKNISVIGSGTMGNGIAHVFAQYGFKVSLVDINNQLIEKGLANIITNLDRQIKKELITEETKKATLSNIKTFTSLKDGVCEADMVVEATTENPDIKFGIFKNLDEFCPAKSILATNTSSISITKIEAHTERPQKVIGMHFMNPVPMMKLVEVIKGYSTSGEVIQSVMDLSKKVEKVPVQVNDYPGFVANRLLMPMINEAVYALFEGVGGVREIDTVMRLGMAHPMGPLQLADFIGLDICVSIMHVLYEGYGNPKYAPCPLLLNMVEAGKLGVKSGEGFYNYSSGIGSKEMVVSERFL